MARFYIVDNQGNIYGDSDNEAKAETMLNNVINDIGADEAKSLEIEIITVFE